MAVEKKGTDDHHRWTSTLQTRFNPCVIELLKAKKLENSIKVHHYHFIIGTYELVEEGSELAKQYSAEEISDRNGRVGTLEVLEIDDNKSEKGQLVIIYECPFGGVFDLRVLDHPQEEQEDQQFLLVTAHANGVVALYSFCCSFQNQLSYNIELLKSWTTGSKMLTTVEVIKSSSSLTSFYAGSEDGQLIRVNYRQMNTKNEEIEEEEVISLGKLTDFGHPIWYLRACPIEVSNNHRQNLLFIGSEDSKWRVVNSSKPKPLLYSNSDAEAGVTAFEFLPTISSSSSKPETSGEIKVLIGSYDEHLRLYRLSYSIDEDCQKVTIDSVRLLYRIPIAGGGVWRIRTFFGSSPSAYQILIAAMYAGVFLLTFDKDKIYEGDWPKESCESMVELKVPPKTLTNSSESTSISSVLIYGISASEDLSAITFASFYQRELYVFQKR